MLIRDIIVRRRHDGCGGLAAKAKLLTGIEEQAAKGIMPLRIAPRGRPAFGRYGKSGWGLGG